jgi:hypothetical protein
MGEDISDLISSLHAAGRQAALALTGGGSSAGAWLLSVPGGSRSVLEVVVPYSQQALDDYLGCPPASYCSADTARRMARRARERAAWLAPGEEVVGLGCTASLRSDRPKKGDHRAHVAAATAGAVLTRCLTLAKDQRDRPGEEDVVARLVLDLLGEVCGIARRPPLPLLPGEQVEAHAEVEGLLAELLAGQTLAVCVEPDGRLHADAPKPALLLSGSFNPLHEGHQGLAAAAAALTGKPAAYELTVVNADKPPLGGAEVRRRTGQFAWKAPLWLTRAPTFLEKARLFPGVVFVVGADTAARVVQERFYGDSAAAMRSALVEVRRCGCRFLVAGRVDGQGRFIGLDRLGLPAEFGDLFDSIPEGRFRRDVSSTALRAAGKS